MTSITTVYRFRTTTADQMRVSIPKEIIDRFKLKGNEKTMWEIRGSRVRISFLKND